MISPDDKQKFLEALEATANVLVSCKRTNIARASIYRWLADDPEFKKNYTRAMKQGRDVFTDFAESKLLRLVEKEHLGAIKMVLEANSKRYYRPRKPMAAPREITPVQTVRIEVVPDGISQEEYDRKREENREHNQRMRESRFSEDDPWKDMPT